MREAIHNMSYVTFKAQGVRMFHPVSGPLELIYGIKVDMGPFFKKLHDNSARLKRQINKYVQRRKSGADHSKMQGFDLLSVFLEDQQMFPDEKII